MYNVLKLFNVYNKYYPQAINVYVDTLIVLLLVLLSHIKSLLGHVLVVLSLCLAGKGCMQRTPCRI